MIIFIVAALITMVFVDEYRTVVLSTGAAALAVVAVGLLRHGRGARACTARGQAAGAGGRRPWPVVLQPGPGWPIASVFSRWNNPYAHLFY